MPNQITDRNTRMARAASVSSRAVGGSIPGTSEDQFATRMNTKSVPMKPRYGAGAAPVVSEIWVSSVATISSRAA
jgi:hypothetical protein